MYQSHKLQQELSGHCDYQWSQPSSLTCPGPMETGQRLQVSCEAEVIV